MTVLIDIVHPAHVHFYKHIAWNLMRSGVRVVIAARDKDVTCSLLDNYGFAYETLGKSARNGLVGLAGELLRRDKMLVGLARRVRAKVILTRNPAGAQVGRLLRIKSIFDTDDGPAAGLHYYAAAPFAHVITSPDAMRASLGSKHVKYPGYKQTAYLHPNHFRPNPEVLGHLGVSRGERYFIVRFVAMVASHDSGESGLPVAARLEVVKRLAAHGKVFVSSEAGLPREFTAYHFRPPPHMMHDALAFADLLVGDSQTMAAEAAVLGTPSLRVSSWKGRLDYLDELETRYGLTESFAPHDIEHFFERLAVYTRDPGARSAHARKQERMLADKCDVAAWYTRYVQANF